MLPNLIIIGAPKAGTTSLHRYLDLHPAITMTSQKELRYFWREDWRERRSWYESQFGSDTPVRGEATPAYAAYSHRPHVPERMHELIPDTKLLYLVRDPIERTISHWVQRRADGDLTSFARYMAEYDRLDNPIVCPSRYWTQVKQYLAFYDASQLLVIDQQQLRTRRRETLSEIFRFLGVDVSFDSSEFQLERNTRAEKNPPRWLTARLWDRVLWPISRTVPARLRDEVRGPANRLLFGPVPRPPKLAPEMRERLSALLVPEVDALREFTGQPFASWSL